LLCTQLEEPRVWYWIQVMGLLQLCPFMKDTPFLWPLSVMISQVSKSHDTCISCWKKSAWGSVSQRNTIPWTISRKSIATWRKTLTKKFQVNTHKNLDYLETNRNDCKYKLPDG
jgi:hypothetical protein